jgi:hypothetical protein
MTEPSAAADRDLSGRPGTMRDLLRLLKTEEYALQYPLKHGEKGLRYLFHPRGGSEAGTPPLLPLGELVDAAHRCIALLQNHVINPAIPPAVREGGLANLASLVRLVQKDVLRRRLALLADFFLDPVNDLASFQRDVDAANESPAYYCYVDPTVRTAIRELFNRPAHRPVDPRIYREPLGPNTLVSNFLVLVLAVAPFDAVWLTVMASGSYDVLREAGSTAEGVPPARTAMRSWLERQVRQAEALEQRALFFAVPPPEPADADGVVVGGAEDRESRKARRWAHAARTSAPSRREPLDAGGDSPPASPVAPAASSVAPIRRPVAIILPPVVNDAPLVARIGSSAVVRSIVHGQRVEDPLVTTAAKGGDAADEEWRVYRSSLRPPARSVRSQAVADFMQHLNRGAADTLATPPEQQASVPTAAVKAHRREGAASPPAHGDGMVGEPSMQPAARRRSRRYPPIGRGISGIPDDVQLEILSYLTPRMLRAAQRTCRRLAFLLRQSALKALVDLSYHFSRRVAWFFEDEWGERVASLATLPSPPPPTVVAHPNAIEVTD